MSEVETKIWQRAIGLPADGNFGPLTLATSLKVSGLKAAVISPLPSNGEQMIYQGSAKYPVREIVLHCTATPPSWMASATNAAQFAEIRRWHMNDRGWKDIGYHHVISRNGATLPGRPETVIGAGVEGHNSGVIHISLVGGGGSSATDLFSRNFTTAQDDTTRRLIREISARTGITKITGHNEHAAKACPGFMVAQWLKGGN